MFDKDYWAKQLETGKTSHTKFYNQFGCYTPEQAATQAFDIKQNERERRAKLKIEKLSRSPFIPNVLHSLGETIATFLRR